MPKIVIASDKFKGSATAEEVAGALEEGLRSVLGGAVQILAVPVADGGDGTVDAALKTCFQEHMSTVTSADGSPLLARHAFSPTSRTAVLEVAEACGLARLDPDRVAAGNFDAGRAGTRGVGELVREALDLGARRILLGLGGSATTDAGAGMAQALGARILDARGQEVGPGGLGLEEVDRVDLSGLDPRLAETEVVIASDVTHRLCGPEGAAAVFGPQKGLAPEQIPRVDAALRRLAGLVAPELAEHPGAGAAGGLGFGAMAFLGGELRSGIQEVLEMVGFDQALEGADLVITGEGRLDAQTLQGKAPAGVAARARTAGVPVVAVCGVSELSAQQGRVAGLSAVHALSEVEPDLRKCVRDPLPLLRTLGHRIAGEQYGRQESGL